MTEKQIHDLQVTLLARFILSRLLAQGAQVQVLSLDFFTGQAIVKFDPGRADVALLAALTGGAA